MQGRTSRGHLLRGAGVANARVYTKLTAEGTGPCDLSISPYSPPFQVGRNLPSPSSKKSGVSTLPDWSRIYFRERRCRVE